MPSILIYLCKVSLSLAAVFLFYQLVLRRLTFYNWNRWYLLVYSALSFLVPFIDISPVLERNELADSSFVNWVPVFRTSQQYTESRDTLQSALSVIDWMSLLVLAGIAIMVLRIMIQFISFRRMKKNADYICIGAMHVYQVNENIIPFSFGNNIFINKNLHTEAELEEIIRHEFVHVRQRHSIDMIWGELLCLVCWFNPFAWLLKKAIRQNLEFIADNKVLQNGISKKEYQYLLLKVTGNNFYSIATPFNFSSLKKRIAMMNKIKSARVHLLKFMFVLPLAAIIMLAFRSRWDNHLKTESQTAFGKEGPDYDHFPAKLSLENDGVKGIYPSYDTIPRRQHLPEAIASISVMRSKESKTSADPSGYTISGIAVVKRKDGKKEQYDLNKSEDLVTFEKKYGVSLLDVLPPPPPPPSLPAGVKDISLNKQNIVSVTMENGSVEKYDLNNKEEKKTFENKYGNMPTLPYPASPASPATPAPPIPPVKEIAVAGQPVVQPSDLKTVVVAGQPVPASAASPKAAAIAVVPVAAVPADLNEVVVQGYPLTSAKGPGAAVVSGSVLPRTGDFEVTEVDEAVSITISKRSTKQQLNEYIRQMKQYGVELIFDDIEYNSKGILTKISGSLKSKNSSGNFSGQDFKQLTLVFLKKDDKTWFKINIQDDNESL